MPRTLNRTKIVSMRTRPLNHETNCLTYVPLALAYKSSAKKSTKKRYRIRVTRRELRGVLSRTTVKRKFPAVIMSCESEVVVVKPASPATTYEWLCTLPMATSAGSAVSSFYEGSKNYNCVTQYALGTVESSVKKAASTVAPVVQKLDRPSKISLLCLVGGFIIVLI